MFTGAGSCGAANCHVGIPPASIIATFIDPRWKAIQNLSQIDELSKDEVKFKVLEMAKLDEAVARVVAQLSLSFAKSPLPLPLHLYMGPGKGKITFTKAW